MVGGERQAEQHRVHVAQRRVGSHEQKQDVLTTKMLGAMTNVAFMPMRSRKIPI